MLGLGTGITNTSYQWQPNMVGADLKLWLRNGVGVTAAQWDDSSGSGKHAVQGTGGSQATPSGGGLEFDGSDDHYDLSDSGITVSDQEGFMAFIVLDIDSFGGGTGTTLLSTNGTDGFVDVYTNKKLRIRFDNDTAIVPTFGSIVFATDEKMILGIQREAGGTGNINVYRDGTYLSPSSQVADSGPITFTAICVRNNDRHVDGHIYEVLFYDTADLTTAEIGKINNYLINKHAPLG